MRGLAWALAYESHVMHSSQSSLVNLQLREQWYWSVCLDRRKFTFNTLQISRSDFNSMDVCRWGV